MNLLDWHNRLKSYGVVEPFNFLKNANLNPELTSEDKNFLEEVLSQKNHETIRLEDFLKDYNLSFNRYVDGKLSIKISMFLDIEDYKLPKKLKDLVEFKISDVKNSTLDEYSRQYSNPKLAWTHERVIRKTKEFLYDFGIQICSFGKYHTVRKSEEELVRDSMTYEYNDIRHLPSRYHFAKELLRQYFEFEESLENTLTGSPENQEYEFDDKDWQKFTLKVRSSNF